MTFQQLDCLSLPGDAAKPNEDAFGHGDSAAVVLDGATMLGDSLMPGPSDAAWIAQFGARRVLAHLRDGHGGRKALRNALGDAQKSFEALRRMPPQAMWQMPCASMMLVTQTQVTLPSARDSRYAGQVVLAGPLASEDRRGQELEFLWFGDCAAFVQQDGKAVQIIGESFDRRAAETARAQAWALEKNAAVTDRGQFTDRLRAARNRINSGSHWLFSPDMKAASHAARRVMTCAPGTHVLLASDGFTALASDYGAYTADTLMAAVRGKGLAALGAELRAIEAADARGEKFARFKVSDDATALLLRLQ